jgi:hypothetical protein
MEKRIIYRTEVSVSNMMLEAEKGMEICSEEVKEAFLAGYISHYSRRKLFGLIPLPDKYVYNVCPYLFVRNKCTYEVYLKELSFLSFESKKRLMEETQNLESWLRNKCKQYKQSKQDE